jgi:ABC-2 type transport system ATP-binding protein
MTIFYSSHILDDVERIADHVVVVDRGSVVDQGPMNRFLGGSSTTYAVSLDGDSTNIVDHLGAQPWVTATRPIGGNGWEIETVDRLSAEHMLLRALTEGNGTRVTDFRPVRRNLEDIYLDLVEAGSDD